MAAYDDQEIEDLSRPGVIGKYKTAADVANAAMQKLMAECQAGKKVVDLCRMGDSVIASELEKVDKIPADEADERDHGVAFPTCISINNCAGHFSPLSEDTTVLKAGDMVKIDLGAHVDGFAAVCAQTVFVAGGEPEVTDRRADVVTAAYAGVQAAARMFRPGVKNAQISEVIEKVAQAYGVSAVEGVLTHNMERYVIDGGKVIMNKPTAEQRVDEIEIEKYEVYGLDIVMSTGEGKNKDNGETRCTVFKRNPEVQYLLKLKASRFVLSEINKNFPAFPFTLRAMSDEKRAKLGVTEMSSHNMLDQYPVLFEKSGEFVAQCKATIFVMPTGPCIVTGVQPVLAPQAKSAKTAVAMADETLKAAMAVNLLPIDEVTKMAEAKKKKKASKGKRAAKRAAETEAAAAPAAAEAPKEAERPAAMDVDKKQ